MRHTSLQSVPHWTGIDLYTTYAYDKCDIEYITIIKYLLSTFHPNVIIILKGGFEMKPFIGIDITENKKNEELNGKEFIVASASAAQSDALENASDKILGLLEKSELPRPLRILQWVGIIGGIIILSGIGSVIGEDGISLSEIYSRTPWLFWLGGILLITGAVLFIMSLKRTKNCLEGEENEACSADIDTITANIFAELGIPSDAVDIDLLSFNYKLKGGEPIPKETVSQLAPYSAFSYKCFTKDGYLYLADSQDKYGFPISELRAIHTVNKKITVFTWHGDDEFKDIYKQYKIKEDDYGNIRFKPYHILELEHNGEAWGIYFPCYELSKFEKLTGLSRILEQAEQR